jgi:hypothetical protein
MKVNVETPSSVVRRRQRRWGLWLALIFLVLPAVLLAGYTWVTLHYAYSSGERVGYVQKISTKGWLCKTWEGELAMTPLPGVAPQLFQFSVRDDAVAHKIEGAAGHRVALSYQQHRGVPSTCFGETEYFITGVRTVDQ